MQTLVGKFKASQACGTRRLLAGGVALLLGATVGVAYGPVAPAVAAEPTLSIALSVVSDGTAPWEGPSFVPGTGANPGNDDGATNGVVRVNDTVRYQLQYGSAGSDAENTTFTVKLSKGMELQGGLPVYCDGSGSSLTPATVAVPVPITAATMAALPEQVLVCNVGTLEAGTAYETFDVKVLNAAHNGTVLPILEASITADEVVTPVQAPSLPSVTATARLDWDVSKNGVGLDPNTGAGASFVFGPCSFDDARYCYRAAYSLLISAPGGDKGRMPAIGDVTVVDDISPAALYTNLDATALAAMSLDLDLYGARLSEGGVLVAQPGDRINLPARHATNSVRDSGSLAFDTAGPGQPVEITISGTDWSLATVPSEAYDGTPLPTNNGYAVAKSLYLEIPQETVLTFGVPGAPPGTNKLLQTNNTFTELEINGFDPVSAGGTDTLGIDDQPTWNDSRTGQINWTGGVTGTLNKSFAGVAGAPGNMTGNSYTTNLGVPEGPPGDATRRSGEVLAVEGQDVVSLLDVSGSTIESPADSSIVLCDVWDNTRLYLRTDDGTVGSVQPNSWGVAQRIPGDGRAVWVSGYNNVPNPPSNSTRWATTDTETPQITRIEYSSALPGGSGVDSECGDTLGAAPGTPGGWQTDPNHPSFGNDPALAAQGVYTGVNRVRVHLVLPAPAATTVTPTNEVRLFLSIGMRVAETGNPAGDILPNWSSDKRVNNPAADQRDMSGVLGAAGGWNRSSFVPATMGGNLRGDRLKLAKSHARIAKDVRRLDPVTGDPIGSFQSTTTLAVLAGDTVQYRLRPTLTSPAQAAQTQDVMIEDCLPAEHEFVSAAPLPAGTVFTQSSTTPADAQRAACGAGQTYLRWLLPDMPVNQTIDPIIVTVDLAQSAPSGQYLNTVQVGSGEMVAGTWQNGDPSPAAARRSNAGVQLTARSSMQIVKTALTPVVQVNPADNADLETNRWSVLLRNAQPASSPAVTAPDIIDVLPVANGVNGSAYTGTFELVSVSNVTAGATVLYSASSDVNADPADPSNGAAGATAWCDAPSGGTLVSGTGACPTGIATVTALRVQKPGAFPVGAELGFEIEMVAEGNAAGDVYVNRTAARAAGFDFPVGPVNRPERVEASSIGDYVWWDFNRDGVQNDFDGAPEQPAEGVTVQLTGFDDLGNEVDLETETGADGKYAFTGLRASDADGYAVTFVAPNGVSFTGHGQGGDPALDSDADPATGEATVVLSRNTADRAIDAGLLADGGLRVQKLLDGAGAGGELVSDGDVLVFDVVCTLDGTEVYSDDDLTLTVANGAVSVLSGAIDLPALAECVITELSTDRADALADPVTVTVPWDADDQVSDVVTASLTNHYSAGTIAVGKRLAGDPAAVAAVAEVEFEIEVTCQVEVPGDDPETVFSDTVTLKGGEQELLRDGDGDPVRLPIGTRCFAEETDDGGAASVAIDHDSFENAAEVVAGDPDTLQALEIEVVNTFELPEGTLVITKLLDGVGVVPFAGEDGFVFHVLCTYEGGTVYDDTVALQANGATSITSDPIGPMPATTSCVITETSAGSADDAATPVTVVIPWDPTTWRGGEVVASLTNYYSAGTITVAKQLEGDAEAVDYMSDAVFEVLVTCQIDESVPGGGEVRATLYSGTVKLKGGQTKMLVDEAGEARVLPIGARCFGAETEDGGADRITIDADSFDNGIAVTAGTPDDLQQLRITVVNEFDCTDEICPPKKEREKEKKKEKKSGNEELEHTGAPAGAMAAGAIGAAALMSAGLLLMLRRRRKESRID